MLDLSLPDWLAGLVDGELAAYDPATARLKLAPELRSGDPAAPTLEARARALLARAVRPRVADAAPDHPLEAFVRPIREHVQLLLDIALVFERPFERERRRAELAMLFAAHGGDADDALAADPARPHRRSAAAVRRAFQLGAAAFVERDWPPGDPRGGLPLRAGLLCIERRHLARLAIDYHRGGALQGAPVRRRLAQARRETTVLFEALSASAAAAGPLDRSALRASLRQLSRLDLPRKLRDRARVALATPRRAEDVVRAVHPRLRPFVFEQLLVAAIAREAAPAHEAFLERFAAEAGIARDEITALQAEAALLYATEQRWIERPATATDAALAGEWQESAEQVVQRVSSALSSNLDALVVELRQTGELGQLLAKAAGGQPLRDDERAKVKAQLIDLAKVLPALALVAAPGGMLLLPVLAKILPWNVLPSAWSQPPRPELPAAGASAKKATADPAA